MLQSHGGNILKIHIIQCVWFDAKKVFENFHVHTS